MQAMTEQTHRTDFTDLLRARRAELGRSLREIAARCIDADSGEQVKFGWLYKVEHVKTVDPPNENRLKAIAAGYGLPLRELQRAASRQFFGYDPAADSSVVWSGDLTTRLIVARAEEMTDEEREQYAAIAETFARRRAQRSGGAEEKSGE